MKRILFTLLIFICLQNVSAQLLLKENFDYTQGTALELQPTWDWMSSQATAPIMVESGAYTYTDYPAGTGNKVVVGASGEDLYRTFPRQTSGSVYAAFLVNVSAALTGGEYFIGFSSNPISKTDYQGRIYVKKDASNKLAFGVTRTKSDRIGYSGFTYDMNTTYLIILKYEIVSGATNDVCSMTINPVIANGELGATWITTTSADNSAETANVVGAIALRQVLATTAAKISGLRVATSWADLTDVNANVSGLVLNTDDGLKINFNASASGTSAVQSFKLSGTGLSDNVTISTSVSPKYFEFSTDNVTYSDNITLTQNAGSLAETTVYIRMKSSVTTGTNLSNTYNIISTGVNQTALKATGNIIAEAVWNGSTWTGTTGAANNAIINGNYTGAGFNCLDLTVNSGKQMTVNSGTLAVSGNMTLKSDAANGTATFVDNGGTLSVGANKTFVEQHLTSGRNWYISSPLSAATSNVFATSASNPMYYYVESTPGIWPQISNSTTSLETKKGYIANINSNRVVTFTGGDLNTGTQTISGLTRDGATYTGFNLVGNPYPSYLDWSTVSKTNVSTSIWYRSKSTGTYLFQTYNVAGAGIGTNGGTNLIPPMQAFWVKVTSGTGSIGLTNNDRTHLDQSYATNRLKIPVQENRTIVRLQVSNQQYSDETVIYTDAQASNSLDEFDSNKMFNNNVTLPEIYTLLGEEKLAINGYKNLSENQEIMLGFKTNGTGTFTISAVELKNMPADVKPVLIDKQQNYAEYDFSNTDGYTFESDIVNTSSRFSIVFKSSAGASGLPNSSAVKPKVFVNSDKQICINAPVNTSFEIYSSLGLLIDIGVVTSNSTILSNDILKSGIYVIKLFGSCLSYSSKIVLK